MSEEFGNNFVVLCDEEGVEQEFEHLDTLEYEGVTYMAFIPAAMSLEEEAELVILRLEGEGTDDETLATIEDEELAERLFGMFVARLDEADFYGDDEEGEDEEDEE